MYNKSEIMKAAWAMHRENVEAVRRWPAKARQEKLANSFSTCLKMAWAIAKQAIENPADPKEQLFLLKMKDRWDNSDFELARELEAKIARQAA